MQKAFSLIENLVSLSLLLILLYSLNTVSLLVKKNELRVEAMNEKISNINNTKAFLLASDYNSLAGVEIDTGLKQVNILDKIILISAY